MKTEIIFFDATKSRRERMRTGGARAKADASVSNRTDALHIFPAPTPVAPEPKRVSSPPTLAPQPAPAQTAAPASVDAGISTEELDDYLINFVVEQTGYPEEMVELDADLEGDLGIDSIKKAQLLGELNEMFHFSTAEDMNGGTSIDDFATLRSIRNFILKRLNGTATPDAPPVASASQAAPAQTEAPASTDAGISAEELDGYLINFVVEQTGYPEEMVELDADLEGDLGIDSIKKAQLLGELNEMFHFSTEEDQNGSMTLDDFPTLRAIRDFMLKRLNGAASKPTHAAQSTTPPAPQPAPEPAAESAGISAEELDDYLINFVVEQTGYPEEMVELDADLEGDLGIDSIKKAQLLGELNEMFHFSTAEDMNGGTSIDDFTSLRSIRDFILKRLSGTASAFGSVSASENRTPTANSRSDASDRDEKREKIRSYLVDFIVEQTGYPCDSVSFDADLENVLAIDSVKKAQLFGELAENYSVYPLVERLLEDFHTLRDIYDAVIAEL